MKKFLLVLASLFLVVSCGSLYKVTDRKKLETNAEFEKKVKIKKIDPPPQVKTVEDKKEKPKSVIEELNTKTPSAKSKKKKVVKKKQRSKKKKNEKKAKPKKEAKTPVKRKRQPPMEDSEGFDGRRPIVDPFRVGESVTLRLSYFKVEAGRFTMSIKPMVELNGRPSYHFHYYAKSSKLFSLFYSVDDVAETYVDYETLTPHSYEIHVKESKQVRDTRSYFDWKKKKGYVWDKKKRPGKPLEEKKYEWEIFPFSQNVFSAAYYLRTFHLKVGKKLRVRVGHEGKNIVMTAEVLRKQKIRTRAGNFETFVVRPTFKVDGLFKATGENLLFLTADDRKMIVRMESKIKIGTIVGEVEKITR